MEKANVTLHDSCVLITGAAGFIGAHLSCRLLREFSGIRVVGIDTMSPYYDVQLKEMRLREIEGAARTSGASWSFERGGIEDKEWLEGIFRRYCPKVVVNLAAQAGVRYSVTHPDVYVQANVVGFFNILELCRRHPVEHLVYASSSSVYGMNEKQPYSECDMTDRPVSLYAATKKSDELLAFAYSSLYKIPSTGVRLFTVYGPWGRPDMAYFSFAEKMVAGEKLELFNHGNCKRDFTYIDDSVEGILRVILRAPDRETSHRVFNVGGSQPVVLGEFVATLCEELKCSGALSEDYELDSHVRHVDSQPGDVVSTWADCTALERATGFCPQVRLREGLREYAEWYSRVWLCRFQ